MERYNNEGFLSYAERLNNLIADGDIGYQEWSRSLLGDSFYSDETLRRCYIFLKKFMDKLSEDELSNIEEDKVLDMLRAKADLERERIKLSDEKRELRDSYRWQARNEEYKEKIIGAINRLEPINVPKVDVPDYVKVDTTALMCISDIHCGSTFEVKGLYGEVVNKYNYDVMQSRFWKLLNDFCEDDIAYDDITIAVLGDCFENVLRMSSLTKLREPVIDTVIKFSHFLANFILEVQRRTGVPVRVICCGGNHDVQRILGGKPDFEDENLTKIVVEFLRLRLNCCEHIVVEDYNEIFIDNIRGTSIMFTHGVDKDLQVAIEYFSNLYNIDIDEVIGGHYHRPESKTIGITDLGDRIITRVGSIVGTDTFAKKIRVSARPSAYVALYTDEGKTWSRNYYL